MIKLPRSVRLTEVGPRDGLQNQPLILPTADKINFVNRLTETGLSVIETTAFVSSKRIPQLFDNCHVFSGIDKKKSVSYPVLVPNVTGLELAMSVGVTEIAVFISASEIFSQKNINCSIAESLIRVNEIMCIAVSQNISVRGYISCVAGCPYEGNIRPEVVSRLAEKLLELGCNEIALGDTIGVGTPGQITDLINVTKRVVSLDRLSVHFHDTYGQALANIYAALRCGINKIDSSVAGLGGCPYAKGASGNVATEDVVYMLNGLGIKTGIDLEKLIQVGRWVCKKLNCPVMSKVSQATS